MSDLGDEWLRRVTASKVAAILPAPKGIVA